MEEGDLSEGLSNLRHSAGSNGSPKMPPRVPMARKRSSSTGNSAKPRSRRNTLTRSIAFPSAVLPVEILLSLRRYCLCFALVNFDLDKGNDVDSVWPATPFTPSELSDIAFSSFPDSATQGVGLGSNSLTTFTWRIPRDRTRQVIETQTSYDFLYGHVSFSQQKSEAFRRNYLQRSLVLITHRPEMIGLFSTLMDMLGPLHTKPEAQASAIIEVAIANIAKWPDPTPGTMLELNFLGTIHQVDLPLPSTAQCHDSGQSPSIPRTAILASCPLIPLSMLFQHNLSKLWLLWELVALAEPILVYCPNDLAKCTAAVFWLTALIRPLRYGGDYRPYLHIHSNNFASIVNNNAPRQGYIIGCTSPLLFSACRHWPHVLTIHDSSSPTQGNIFGTTSKSQGSHSFREAQNGQSGLYSEKKRTIKRDDEVLRLAQDRVRAGDFLQADAILIRHFSHLSQSLLVPLNRYFATLHPHARPGDKPIPSLPFSNEDFVQSIKTYDTPLKFRRPRMPGSSSAAPHAAISLYHRFASSPNFAEWLRIRLIDSDEALRSRYLSNLETMNLSEWAKGRNGREVNGLLRQVEAEISTLTMQEEEARPFRSRSLSQDATHQLSVPQSKSRIGKLEDQADKLRLLTR